MFSCPCQSRVSIKETLYIWSKYNTAYYNFFVILKIPEARFVMHVCLTASVLRFRLGNSVYIFFQITEKKNKLQINRVKSVIFCFCYQNQRILLNMKYIYMKSYLINRGLLMSNP